MGSGSTRFPFADHGEAGSGETLAGMLRTGSAGANTAGDHIAVLDAALAQLPKTARTNVLVRTDTGGGVKQFLHHMTDLGLEYSVGFYGMPPIVEALGKVPRQAWRSAIDGDGLPREGAQVAELTGYLPATLTGWPKGMRVIARRERPHPGAQLRLTDDEGWRITCFATNTKGWRLADLEVRHRQRARAEDRIRNLKDTGLRNLPFHGFAQNQLWLEIIALAADLLVWTQTLAWHDLPARRWEPKRLRFRLLTVAGRITRSGRRRRLRASGHGATFSTPDGPPSNPAEPATSTQRPGAIGEPANTAPEITAARPRPSPPQHLTDTAGRPDERSRLCVAPARRVRHCGFE